MEWNTFFGAENKRCVMRATFSNHTVRSTKELLSTSKRQIHAHPSAHILNITSGPEWAKRVSYAVMSAPYSYVMFRFNMEATTFRPDTQRDERTDLTCIIKLT